MNRILPVDPALLTDACFAQVDATRICATQLGAMCWRMHQGRLQILLITSRDTGRWVIPKGWPMAGKTLPEAAAVEAWQEAGVEGLVQPAVLGRFYYDKVMAPKPSIACIVSVFGLRVARLKRRFPERKQRQRKWFSLEKAQLLVAEAGLSALLRDISDNPAFRDAAMLDPA